MGVLYTHGVILAEGTIGIGGFGFFGTVCQHSKQAGSEREGGREGGGG